MTTTLRHENRAPVTTTGAVSGPTALLRLFVEQGQSPWLDRLSRHHVEDGSLRRMVSAGIRGVIADLSAPATAIDVSDVQEACDILRPVYDSSDAIDGFVSVEVPPAPSDRSRSPASALWLRRRIDRPNLLVAIPATSQGILAIRSMVSAGANINATSIFSIDGYSAVIDAYLSGLEVLVAEGGDPGTVHGVATFAVARVDEAVNRQIDEADDRGASRLHSLAGVAQAKLAYRIFQERFSTERWERLAGHGAHPQRLLWSSEADIAPGLEIAYVEDLIGPNTVRALSESAVTAFEDHGVVDRTLDTRLRDAAWALSELGALGVDLDEVGAVLQAQRAERARFPDRAMDRFHTDGPGR